MPSNSIYDLRFTIYERLRISLLALLSLLLFALASSHIQAGTPEAMTYQGFLVDANGNPLATNNPANYPVIFRIFAASSGGASLWSEQQIVTVDNGNFSVILSEGTPVGAEPRPLLSAVMGTNGADRYIQLSVTISGSTLDMLPRMRLLPSPYAFLSTSASQLVNPVGAAVLTYANSRVEVPGTFFAGSYAGNGSGLSGLTAAQIGTGTFADARLSPNVALRAGGNTFTGDQIIIGNLGIGGPPVDGVLDVEGPMHLNAYDLYFAGGADHNHGLGYYGPGKPFAGVAPDGPVLYGFSGGGLGSKSGGEKLALTWNGNGDVGIGTTAPTGKLTVNGGVVARGGPPGLGNTNDNGFAFTGNGGDLDSGMFSSADGQVEIWAQNTERMRVTSAGASVNGNISATNEVRFGTTSQYNAVGGSAALRIVSGILPPNPPLNFAANGPGWTALGLGNNNWRVTFTTPFAAQPSVVCSWVMLSNNPWNGANPPSAPVVGMNGGATFTIKAETTASDTSGFNFTCSVNFIAVGLR